MTQNDDDGGDHNKDDGGWNGEDDNDDNNHREDGFSQSQEKGGCGITGMDGVGAGDNNRRDLLRSMGASILAAGMGIGTGKGVNAANNVGTITNSNSRSYVQRFPAPFDPILGKASFERETILRKISDNVWALEQNLSLGVLETPLRCVVVRLKNGGGLWVHAPLAPTEEFFRLVESCAGDGDGGNAGSVKHVVVPTYALEHKIFVRDALKRWTNAKLWTSPGQFSFPIQSVSESFVFGRKVDGVLSTSDRVDAAISSSSLPPPPWIDEIQYETLSAGSFNIGGSPKSIYETIFYHVSSKTLIVTDSLAQVNLTPPTLNTPQSLLIISKRSTNDDIPPDTPEYRQIGWEKSALLISYFFPEHEELDPEAGFGVVTWTDGWHDNFSRLAGRLIVPPVVRTLLYQKPQKIEEWVERVCSADRKWDFVRIVPAHWDAPIVSSPDEFRKAFRFLKDDSIDAFPEKDLERGLSRIANVAKML